MQAFSQTIYNSLACDSSGFCVEVSVILYSYQQVFKRSLQCHPYLKMLAPVARGTECKIKEEQGKDKRNHLKTRHPRMSIWRVVTPAHSTWRISPTAQLTINFKYAFPLFLIAVLGVWSPCWDWLGLGYVELGKVSLLEKRKRHKTCFCVAELLFFFFFNKLT